jgi:hypothetical protein
MDPIIKTQILKSLDKLYYKMNIMTFEESKNELEEWVCKINPHTLIV